MNTKTLFITNRDDISVEYLISKFRLKSDLYLRINSEDIDTINFEINPTGDSFCHIENTTYDLNNIKSVVFRRTPTKYNTLKKDPDSSYLNNEKKHFFEGLYLTMQNAKWINPMFATHIAERKLHQLQLANKLGLEIPKSIITNSSIKADSFLKVNKKAIIKPISNGLQVLPNKVYSIYTSEIEPNYFKHLPQETIFETPVFLQEKIDNIADIRATIIGDKIFVVKIEKDDNSEVDWRKPTINKKYSIITLPKRLEKKLFQINKNFNLIYSAIDLIQMPNNEYIFLEVNPVGEWVWLEKELGLKISDAFINELL